MIDVEAKLRAAVAAKGGFVNAHAHLDRAFTLPSASLADAAMSLQEKWSFVDGVKRASSSAAYRARILKAVRLIRATGTTASASFVDLDEVAGDRALTAAVAVRERYRNTFPIRLVNQTLKGVLQPAARAWFDRATEQVDIIGGLPKRDAPREAQHLDVILTTAKRYRKLVHVHVDQFNRREERETELLAEKTIHYGMEGRVWAIHCISVAARPERDRRRVYRLLRDAGVGIIACPFVWIDTPRSEEFQPFHNSIAPIDELLDEGIPVALGTDNIADLIKPLGTGDMWLELRLAIEACRLYDRPIDQLVDMVTTNGRKALGLEEA